MSVAFSKTYLVERQSSIGQYINGIYVEPLFTQISIKASIQPLREHLFIEQCETLQLPEGRRRKAAIKIYSDQQLFESSQDVRADIVLYKGKRYEVLKVSDYTDNFLPHYASMAFEEDLDKENA